MFINITQYVHPLLHFIQINTKPLTGKNTTLPCKCEFKNKGLPCSICVFPSKSRVSQELRQVRVKLSVKLSQNISSRVEHLAYSLFPLAFIVYWFCVDYLFFVISQGSCNIRETCEEVNGFISSVHFITI